MWKLGMWAVLTCLGALGCSSSVALRPAKTCDGGNVDECKQACDQGQGRACYRLGWFYEEGQGIRRSTQSAVDSYEKACSANWAIACRALGILYWEGEHVKRSKPKAIEYFNKACGMGVPEACPSEDMLSEAEGRKRKRGAGASGFEAGASVGGSVDTPSGPQAPSGPEAPAGPQAPTAPSGPQAPTVPTPGLPGG